MVTMHLSCTVNEIYSLKDIRVTTLTFCGHVTSSVMWPFDPHGVFPIGGQWCQASIWHGYWDIQPGR